jgi:hypothetical protein
MVHCAAAEAHIRSVGTYISFINGILYGTARFLQRRQRDLPPCSFYQTTQLFRLWVHQPILNLNCPEAQGWIILPAVHPLRELARQSAIVSGGIYVYPASNLIEAQRTTSDDGCRQAPSGCCSASRLCDSCCSSRKQPQRSRMSPRRITHLTAGP